MLIWQKLPSKSCNKLTVNKTKHEKDYEQRERKNILIFKYA
jgi:hypothetical protein